MLEEPDGLAGLVRLRSGPARLQDQLLAAEKAGSWAEALALHEQALQHDTSSKATVGTSFLICVIVILALGMSTSMRTAGLA